MAVFFSAFGIFLQTGGAAVVFESSGISAKGVEVSYTAELSIADDILTLVLTNTSPTDTLNPDDLLSSFYFDIVNADGLRPSLTYLDAFGDVYLGSRYDPDSLVEEDAPMMAVDAKDGTWMFAAMDEMVVPYLGYGIGTVGNSNLAPNNFKGNIVGGMDYSIYKGEITTQNLDGRLLIKETAVFTFSGLTGFSESDIASQFLFGLGTGPDSFLTPEPATLMILGAGLIFLRKRMG